MIGYRQFVLMADYNTWMNNKIYEICAGFSESELFEDRGAFFGSIFHTLNHLVYSDLAFMSRFTGIPSSVPTLHQEMASNFSALRELRASIDKRIVRWSNELSTEYLEEDQSYRSMVDGKVRTMPRWLLITHMFNHQTHHRGQLTTLLSQSGIDFGSTDIPFMPKLN